MVVRGNLPAWCPGTNCAREWPSSPQRCSHLPGLPGDKAISSGEGEAGARGTFHTSAPPQPPCWPLGAREKLGCSLARKTFLLRHQFAASTQLPQQRLQTHTDALDPAVMAPWPAGRALGPPAHSPFQAGSSGLQAGVPPCQGLPASRQHGAKNKDRFRVLHQCKPPAGISKQSQGSQNPREGAGSPPQAHERAEHGRCRRVPCSYRVPSVPALGTGEVPACFPPAATTRIPSGCTN